MANEARAKQSRPMSRRYFLGMLGAGAVAASASSGLLVRTVHAQTRSTRFSPIREDRFGRMFLGCFFIAGGEVGGGGDLAVDRPWGGRPPHPGPSELDASAAERQLRGRRAPVMMRART